MSVKVWHPCVRKGKKPTESRLAFHETDRGNRVKRWEWEYAASRTVEKSRAVEVGPVKVGRDVGEGGYFGGNYCRVREEVGQYKTDKTLN